MKTLKFFVFLLLALAVSSPVLAYEDMSSDGVVRYAISNVQQVGDFYFLRFPDSFKGFLPPEMDGLQIKAWRAQVVLRVLAAFEKEKNVSVQTFTVERDARTTRGFGPQFHGIFLKALPKKPVVALKK